MDKFGAEIILLKGATKSLPRSKLNTVVYMSPSAITLTETGVNATLVPNLSGKNYTDRQSITFVKESIWSDFFCFNFKFNEEKHFPKMFGTLLQNKLGLVVAEEEDTIQFVERVRNSIFDRICYACDPKLIQAARWLANGMVSLNTIQRYSIKKRWNKWPNI